MHPVEATSFEDSAVHVPREQYETVGSSSELRVNVDIPRCPAYLESLDDQHENQLISRNSAKLALQVQDSQWLHMSVGQPVVCLTSWEGAPAAAASQEGSPPDPVVSGS